MNKRTGKEVKEKVINLYSSGLSMAKIGKLFNISAATVMRILDKNGIQKRTKGGIYKLDEEKIIKAYKRGESCQQIADKHNVTCHTISNILEKCGIKRNNIYHNLSLDEDYWENIDRYDKAYFLGLMITDGNVFGNLIRLQLQIKDRKIIETFAEKTHNSNKFIIDKRGNCMIGSGVKRHKWALDIAKYGVIPNKTRFAYLPRLDGTMMPHLIRGIIDGDGWISYKSPSIGICGNIELVTQVRDYLTKQLDIYHVKVVQIGPHLWMINWAAKKDILSIGNFIYKDKQDCYIERKYKNFLMISIANTEVNQEIAQGS